MNLLQQADLFRRMMGIYIISHPDNQQPLVNMMLESTDIKRECTWDSLMNNTRMIWEKPNA